MIIQDNEEHNKGSKVPSSAAIPPAATKLYDTGPLYYLLLEYGIERVPALYDTGAMVSLMRDSVLKRFLRMSSKHIQLQAAPVRVAAVNNSSLQGKCLATIKFIIRGFVFTHKFIVLPDEQMPNYDVLLGQDFWHKHVVYVDTRARTIVCNLGQRLVYYLKNEEMRESNVKVQGKYIVKANSSLFIPVVPRVHARFMPIGYFRPDVRFEGNIDDSLVYPSPDHRGEFHILFRNDSDYDRELDHIHVGTLEELRHTVNVLTIPEYLEHCERVHASAVTVSSVSLENAGVASENQNNATEPNNSSLSLPWKFSVPEHLSLEEKQKIFDCVSRHVHVFVKDEEDHGITNVLEQTIELSDSDPIFIKQYPLEQVKMAAMEEIVDRMLASGKVEDTESPYNTPVLIVPKPKGGWRLVNDFRRLNAITKRQHWPLPRIPEMLESVKGAKWFSSLDMRDAFWQIPIAPEHRQYTAFSTPTRRVQYTVMPMGLINSSHCFARLMSIVMKGLPWVLCYIDDIAIYADTLEELLERTSIVFERLHKAGLKLNGAKTQVGLKEAEILGYIVDENGIRMHPKRVEAMRKWAQPETKTQLRQFIGFCSYNRRFIRNFARIAYPLTSQLGGQKTERVIWTRAAIDAFDQLKNAMCTDVLAFPDFSETAAPFCVEVDACRVSEGAVLTQVQDGVKRILAYASRSFSESEQKWGITQLEAHAIFWALAHEFRRYVYGRKVHVYTDHKPCLAMKLTRMANDRLNRWALALQDFDMDMFHVDGSKHIMADAISRLGYLLRSDIQDSEAVVNVISFCPPDPHAESQPISVNEFIRRALIYDACVASVTVCSLSPDVCADAPTAHETSFPSHTCVHDADALPPQLDTFIQADLSPLMCDPLVAARLPPRSPVVADFVPVCNNIGLPVSAVSGPGYQPEAILSAQRSDPLIKWVLDYLERSPTVTPRQLRLYYTKSTPQRLARKTFQSVANLARHCIIEDGIVYRQGGLYGKQLFVPQSLRSELFRSMHDTPVAGHLGVHHTFLRMSKRYWWPSMNADVRKYVETCFQCQVRNTSPMQNVRVPVAPETFPSLFERMAVDVQGPFKLTSRKNKFIVTFIDVHSRWIEAFSVPDVKATTIAQLFVTQILLRYGPVRSLLSDRGSNFLSTLLRETLKIFNVTKLDIAAYHPEANAHVERIHRMYNDMISKYISETHDDWDLWLPFVQHAYRTSRHSATGYTPYELVFGRTCDDFADISLLPKNKDIPTDVARWCNALRKRAEKMRRTAIYMQKQATEKYLATAPTHEPPNFSIGETVMIKDMNPGVEGNTRKYAPVWISNFIVRARSGPTAYDLIRADDTSPNPQVYVRDVTHIKRQSIRLPLSDALISADVPAPSVEDRSIVGLAPPSIDDAHFIVEKQVWPVRSGPPDVAYRVRHRNRDASFDTWYEREQLSLRFPAMVDNFEKQLEAKRKAEKAETYDSSHLRRSKRHRSYADLQDPSDTS